MSNEILADVAGYYADKLARHGETARGVDWNGEQSQELRFRQLAQIVRPGTAFSLVDIGCGYGAMYDSLKSAYADFAYVGCDIAQEMVDAARQRYAGAANAEFHVGTRPPRPADYAVASGIFNVRLGQSDAAWQEYMLSMIDALHASSTRGFAFNCLTSYSDEDRKRPDLYYADPCSLFDHCKRTYSRNVALLHDYDLYEFTLLVRKAQ